MFKLSLGAGDKLFESNKDLSRHELLVLLTTLLNTKGTFKIIIDKNDGETTNVPLVLHTGSSTVEFKHKKPKKQKEQKEQKPKQKGKKDGKEKQDKRK